MLAFYVQSKQIYTSRSNLMTASLQRSKKRVCILSCLMGHKSERLLGFQARTWSSYSVWIIMASTRSISSGWIIQHFVSYKLQLCQGLQKISYDDFNRWQQCWFQSFCRDLGMILTPPPQSAQPQKLCTANFSSGTLKTPINQTKGSRHERKVQFFFNIVQKAIDPPPPFRLNIMWWSF